MNIIILSEMRVGSRWLHYSLANLLQMGVSPEIGQLTPKSKETVERYFNDNRIAKIHGFTPNEVSIWLDGLDFKMIGVVRNPRDRAVSFAFHNRYHYSSYPFLQKQAETDAEAIKVTLYDDTGFTKSHARQFDLMESGHSTKSLIQSERYIWTSYEWMKEDMSFQIKSILSFLGNHTITEMDIKNTVDAYAFRNITGRVSGQEDRKNLFARKGVSNDWINWFDEQDIENTKYIHNMYFKILGEEATYADL